MKALELRLTHKYVGAYQHLDKWLDVGSIDEIGSRELPVPDEHDICEPRAREVFVLVKLSSSGDLHDHWLSQPFDPDADYCKWVDEQIRQALRDTYTMAGCAHEYDCCGCRSFSAHEADRVTGDLWKVTVHSSRNY